MSSCLRSHAGPPVKWAQVWSSVPTSQNGERTGQGHPSGSNAAQGQDTGPDSPALPHGHGQGTSPVAPLTHLPPWSCSLKGSQGVSCDVSWETLGDTWRWVVPRSFLSRCADPWPLLEPGCH